MTIQDALQNGVATLIDQLSQVFELSKLGEEVLAQFDTSPMEDLLRVNSSVIEAADELSPVAAMLARLFDSIGEHELASAIAAMP